MNGELFMARVPSKGEPIAWITLDHIGSQQDAFSKRCARVALMTVVDCAPENRPIRFYCSARGDMWFITTD